MEPENAGYRATSTFLITAEVLEPAEISTLLKLQPSRSWRRGRATTVHNKDGSVRALGGRHENSGWKLFADPSWIERPLEEQLDDWLSLLQPRGAALRQLSERGYSCNLDVFITEPENVTCRFEPRILQALGELGVGILLSVEVMEQAPGGAG